MFIFLISLLFLAIFIYSYITSSQCKVLTCEESNYRIEIFPRFGSSYVISSEFAILWYHEDTGKEVGTFFHDYEQLIHRYKNLKRMRKKSNDY